MDRYVLQSNQLLDQHQNQPPFHKVLALPIILSDRVLRAVHDSRSFKTDSVHIGNKVMMLSNVLSNAVKFTDSVSFLYERPVRRVFSDVACNLNRTLSLLRKCRRRGFIRRFFSLVTVNDFKRVGGLVDMSIGDVTWLLSVFSGENSLSLPPIASNDPILAWVWSCVFWLYLGEMEVKREGVEELAVLACDSDRNKKVIVEEGGVTPLLKMLRESDLEMQVACAKALFCLVNEKVRARLVFSENGVGVIVEVFREGSVVVQIEVVKVIARMSEVDGVCQEAFARENVIGMLVTLLMFDLFDDDGVKVNKLLRKSIGSAVEINKQMEKGLVMSSSYSNADLKSFAWSKNRKESKNEVSELIIEFKTNCSRALWMLARGNVENCRRITETKGLLCLAKIIEREKGGLQINCLMTVLEITAAAESNPDIRRAAFKTNSPAAKAIADQLLRLIQQSDNPVIKIPAIKAVGQLARTFPARQTQVIGPLVKQLSHRNPDVATESVIALGKFTCPDNFLSAEHSKTIVEFEGVQPLMRLLRGSERTQYHALVLLCYLSMHAGKSEAFQQARLLTALEGADKSVACQYSEVRELVAKAVYHLNMTHPIMLVPQRESYSH